MRLIDADKLKAHYAWWEGGTEDHTLDEMKGIFDTIIDLQPSAVEYPTLPEMPESLERDMDWHLAHKAMGFSDPFADLLETLDEIAHDVVDETIEERHEIDRR